MSDDITLSDYRNHVDHLADVVEERADNSERPGSELVWETVDGDQWITYYGHNLDVLKYADSEPREWQIYAGDTSDYREVLQAMAYESLEKDVYAELRDRGVDL